MLALEFLLLSSIFFYTEYLHKYITFTQNINIQYILYIVQRIWNLYPIMNIFSKKKPTFFFETIVQRITN